jgi:hypothetical protein
MRTSWTAFGDSYSAGIGTGENYDAGGEGSCKRRTGSYLNAMNHQFFAFLGRQINFQFSSCSSAVS